MIRPWNNLPSLSPARVTSEIIHKRCNMAYRKIQEFLLKNVSVLDTNREDRRAFVLRAGLDQSLTQHINYDLPAATFVPLLVDAAALYSGNFDQNHPLILLLKAAKREVGLQEQAQCDRFIRQLQTGEYNDREDETPARRWNIPYQRNSYFIGREEVLDNLHSTLQNQHRAALSQVQAISGLGGIGKTQVVRFREVPDCGEAFYQPETSVHYTVSSA